MTLLRSRDLVAVGRAANEVRNRLHDPERVTFIIDRNLNYTNICVTDCDFCAFYRRPGDAREGYLLPKPVIFKKIEETLAIGGTGPAHAGRPPSRPRDRLLRGSLPVDQGEIQDPSARAVAAGDPAHLPPLEADDPRDADAAARCGPRLDPRRRRRSARRPRSRHHRAEEDEVVGVAERDAPRAPARHLDDGDDDVRARRDARGARRAHAARPRGAGRDRRLPRVLLVDVPGRRQPARRRRCRPRRGRRRSTIC